MNKEMGFLIVLCATSAVCYVLLTRAETGSVPSGGSLGLRPTVTAVAVEIAAAVGAAVSIDAFTFCVSRRVRPAATAQT